MKNLAYYRIKEEIDKASRGEIPAYKASMEITLNKDKITTMEWADLMQYFHKKLDTKEKSISEDMER